MPVFMPCPPAGECTCAASPARKTWHHPIAIYHSDIGQIQRQPRGVVKPDIRPASPFANDLLKAFQFWLVRVICGNFGLELARIRAGQWAECKPPSRVLGPGMLVFAVKSVYSNIADQHSLALPCLTFEAHAEFLPNQAMAAVRANHISGKNLLGRT